MFDDDTPTDPFAEMEPAAPTDVATKPYYQFQKGNPYRFKKGNPGGAYAKDRFADFLAEEVDHKLADGTVARMTRSEALMHKLYERAVGKGKYCVKATEVLLERAYGKVKMNKEDREAMAKGLAGVQIQIINTIPPKESVDALPPPNPIAQLLPVLDAEIESADAEDD